MHTEERTVFFVTSNASKVTSVRRVFSQHGLLVAQCEKEIAEPQLEDVAGIAAVKAARAMDLLVADGVAAPLVLAVDSALHIPSLNGFPGPFVKQVTQWIGPEGYVRLLAGREGRERNAVFVDAIACMSPTQGPRIFQRKVWGTISDRVWEGSGGTGKSAMDKVFVPNGHEKALIAMDADEMLGFRSSNGVEKAYHDAARWFLGAQ